MLRRVHIARLAFQHSPETEQRLASFAKTPATGSSADDAPEAVGMGSERLPEIPENGARAEIAANIEGVRDTLFAAAIEEINPSNPDEVERLFGKFGDKIEHIAGGEVSKDATNVQSLIELVRDKIGIEIEEDNKFLRDLAAIDTNKASREEMEIFVGVHKDTILKKLEIDSIESSDPSTIIDSLQHAFRANVSTIRNVQEEPIGAKHQYLFADDYKRSYAKHMRKNVEDISYFPSAYAYENNVIFNREHESFTDPEKGEVNRSRAVTHELTHYQLDLPKRGKKFVENICRLMKSTGSWKQLTEAVDSVYADGATETIQTNADYVQEALTIYLAGKTGEYGEGQPKNQAVFDIVKAMVESDRNTHLRTLVTELETDVQKDSEIMTKRFGEEVAIDESARKVSDTLGYKVHANSDEADAAKKLENEAKAKLKAEQDKEDQEAQKKKPLTTGELIEKSKGLQEKTKNFIVKLGSVSQQLAGRVEPDKMQEHLAGVADARELMDQNLIDLGQMDLWLHDLHHWTPLDEKDKGISLEQKAKRAAEWGLESAVTYERLSKQTSRNPADEKAADEASATQRTKVQAEIEKILSGMQKPMDEIGSYTANFNEKDAPQQTMWGKIRGVFTHNVSWLSIYDIVKVISIYKEAIVDDYHSRQKIRTYDFAKNINLYKPIDQTLKKQARAANQEESSSFLEYLEKEGFSFDNIFGHDGNGGGLLDQVRHNINRAKAVLEYAADHAWLYHMDRANGHDVYGVDYETAFGKESFRELVQKNEGGKEKEEKRGYERVDKHPDIPFMIKDMREELKEKNIFAVRGILKRIQEKAKYAESNTWAAAELIRAMRDPAIMKVMDKGFLDDVGNIGIGQSAWTLTLFKLMRHAFEDYRTGKNKNISDENVFVQTVERIEKKMAEIGMQPKDDLRHGYDHTVGKVLAGQTVTHNGKHISIFEDDPVFKRYRDYWKGTPTSTEPGKTDDDFFNPGNNSSDVLLLGKTSTSAILVRTSQGMWTHSTRAPNYMGQVLRRDEELGKTDPKAQQTFRTEMREKLKYFIREAAIQDATRKKFPSDTIPSYNEPELARFSDHNILFELHQRKIVTDEDYKAILSNIDQKELGEGNPNLAAWKAFKKEKDDAAAAKEAEKKKKDAEAAAKNP